MLYLPAYTSHILQPLDQSPFSVLKKRFRTEITIKCHLIMNMKVSKSDFIWAWNRARQVAFKRYNIMSGWRVTGIHPRNINKPLEHRLRKEGESEPEMPPLVSSQESSSQQSADEPSRGLTTPRSSRQVREIETALADGDSGFNNPTARQLFRKVRKGLDDLNVQVATLEQENARLKENLKELRPKKRKKVIPNPNGDFTTMVQVWETQAQMEGSSRGARQVPEQQEEEEEAENSSFDGESEPESCIMVDWEEE